MAILRMNCIAEEEEQQRQQDHKSHITYQRILLKGKQTASSNHIL
jgi:hypothetical protein